MTKKVDKIAQIYELLQFLEDCKTSYISEEGKGFIDGLSSAGKYPQIVSKLKYDELLKDYNTLLNDYKRLEESKKSLFGLFK